MAGNLLRRALQMSWPLGVWLLMAPSLGALSDCRADRPPPPLPTATPVPPRATATAASEARPSPTPFLRLSAGTATVAVGEARIGAGQRALVPVTVDDVTSAHGLGAYTLRISFNPSVVQIVSVQGGDPPFGAVVSANINNVEGWVVMVSAQAGTINGPRGPITVANMEVETVGAYGAATTLGLHVAELDDTYGDSMAATEVNGEVRVR